MTRRELNNPDTEYDARLIQMGYCRVDSGTVLLADPCYLGDGFDYDETVVALSDVYSDLANGIITQTTAGDGTYPVYGVFDTASDGKPRAVIIDFDGVWDDDEDED